jgi:hypothetical protein
MDNWHTITESQFPWEREALDFVHAQFPKQDGYHAWSNFEFVADDGSVNEVDLLVLTPWGVHIIEIKSQPGTISGDQTTWKWLGPDGRISSRDNPVILTNRKAKKLASLLGRQQAFKKDRTPFIEHLVFCSHSSNRLLLQGPAAYFACVRDGTEDTTQPGIMGAILRRECPGLKPFQHPSVSRVQIRAFVRAMEQVGIRPMESARRAGDYRLESLFYESPTGTYQDWVASHVSVKSDPRLARIYLEARSIIKKLRHHNIIETDVGRPGGSVGLWILLPGTDAKPTIAGAPIPLTNPAHHEVLTPAWLALS